jgi:DNA helicase-2/ATP-dependent DNA helicase PcrA
MNNTVSESGDENNNIEVYKVIGGPGTGKTTRVVGNPELELDGLFLEHSDQYPLEEQMLVSYTNAGVDEATDRLYRMTDYYKYEIEERVTTIHSRSYQLLGLEQGNIVLYRNKNGFCKRFGLEFGHDDDDDDIMAGDLDEGNALFRMYSWLQSNCLPISEWEQCPLEWEWEENPETLMNEWEAYKREQELVGFGDMIEKVVDWGEKMLLEQGYGPLFPDDDLTTPELFKQARSDPMLDKEALRGTGPFVDTQVLYVDEVQDLTPLQWRWYLLQKLVSDKVFIGGDDDQAIYGWAGADPDFMLGEEGEFEVLETTYRIPREIWDVCDGVIQQVDTRQEKIIEPDGEGGEFLAYRNPTSRELMKHLEDGEWLILFRARYQINEFSQDLHDMGIPFRNMSTFDNWTQNLVKLRDALANLRNGGDTIKGRHIETIMDYATDDMIKGQNDFNPHDLAMGNFSSIDADKVRKNLRVKQDGRSVPMNVRNYLQTLKDEGEINYYEKEALKGNIMMDHTDMSPERIRIGTIHSAKGKEAENVLLATDSTQTIIENMDDELDMRGSGQHGNPITDEERRVHYVGMTRASEKLILAEGVTDADYTISIESLLDSNTVDELEIRGRTAQPGKY